MQFLVTGCYGYIGSVLCKMLKERGHTVIGIDPDTSVYNKYVDYVVNQKVQWLKAPYVFKNEIDGIIHLGASSTLNPSMADPLSYYDNNVGGLIKFLQVLNEEEYDKPFVFASSAAVYGDIRADEPFKEVFSTIPINPYGSTKLIGEKIIADAAKVGKFNYLNCRFFNVAGGYVDVGQRIQQPHLLTSLYREFFADGDEERVFTQYGNNIRDYIHVKDVCRALIAAACYTKDSQTLNISTGIGTYTSDFVDIFRDLIGDRAGFKNETRFITTRARAGDPKYLVGDPKLAKQVLNWQPYFSSLGNIIESGCDYFERGEL